MPFRSETASLAYFHLSIHYGDWRRSVTEACRVVKAGGRVEIWTMDADAIGRSSLGRWFPRVVEIDTDRFPDPSALVRACGCHGDVAVDVQSDAIERSAASWTAAVRGRFVSTLQLLDDDEIERGIAEFQKHYANPDDRYCYELRLTRVRTVVRPY